MMTWPLLTGVCVGIGMGFSSAFFLVVESGIPLARSLVVSLVGWTAVMVPFTFVARNDLRRRDSDSAPPNV
jgi:hypothetical protein